ncbi:MAG: HAD family hydrolase [Rhodospirillales bacterium]|nr:HAD family hydrolase [Rhodospirillales bacterium]
MTVAVFLDRDGVLNRSDIRDGKPFAPTTLEGFEILPGVQGAVAALNDAGFKIIVSTNQPDVKKGVMDKAMVEAMNDQLRRELPMIDDVKVCYHAKEDQCDCRKPKPGMLIEAAAEWGINLERSFMIGDRWSDIDAGKSAGCRTIFIDYQYAEKRPEMPDFTAASLAEAASLILSLPANKKKLS